MIGYYILFGFFGVFSVLSFIKFILGDIESNQAIMMFVSVIITALAANKIF